VVILMAIGERIKTRRIELEMSQRELAKRMGYSNHSTITKIEAGKVDIPQSRIVQFAEVLNTSVSYLMGWQETQKKNDVKTDIVSRMFDDELFLSIVEDLNKLDATQLLSIRQMLTAFVK
jgi:transcriptional regulator with XRE-family HTH domain